MLPRSWISNSWPDRGGGVGDCASTNLTKVDNVWLRIWLIGVSEEKEEICYMPLRCIKPWPNGVASRHKLKTWVYLWLRLARPCVHLRWLAITCAHFVNSGVLPFGHTTQVNVSWVTSIYLLLTNEIQEKSALKWAFLRLACTSVRGNLLVRLFTQRKP